MIREVIESLFYMGLGRGLFFIGLGILLIPIQKWADREWRIRSGSPESDWGPATPDTPGASAACLINVASLFGIPALIGYGLYSIHQDVGFATLFNAIIIIATSIKSVAIAIVTILVVVGVIWGVFSLIKDFFALFKDPRDL